MKYCIRMHGTIGIFRWGVFMKDEIENSQWSEQETIPFYSKIKPLCSGMNKMEAIKQMMLMEERMEA